ncbi:MAG: hypothetical protein HY059_13740 [Proteobacteria bacterium]|nr:hypothetical protein [Pseudomonadota bacterium]
MKHLLTVLLLGAASTASALSCPTWSAECRLSKEIESRKIDALIEVFGHSLTADWPKECTVVTLRYRGNDRSDPIVECTDRRRPDRPKTEVVLSVDKMGGSFRHVNDRSKPTPTFVFNTTATDRFEPSVVIVKPADVQEAFAKALVQVRIRGREAERGRMYVWRIPD